MRTHFLVLDVHNLCYRAWYGLPRLSFNGFSTEVIYGFLQSVKHLRELFGTDNIAFCFEHPVSFRKKIYPAYKQNRHRAIEEDPERTKARDRLHLQINELRMRHLPKAGFKNLFQSHGMESDDIMAAIARSYAHSSKYDITLVTSDSDLYQCLVTNVNIYDPGKKMVKTETWFKEKYGMIPSRWAFIKAVAGCHSDNITGVEGFGEKTALKYALHTLPEKSKAWLTAKTQEGQQIVKRNRRLVELPFDGCPTPELVTSEWNQIKWNAMLNELGIRIRE